MSLYFLKNALSIGVLLLVGASRPLRHVPMQQAANTMVGKPISVAIQAFGTPSLNLPPCSYCTDGGTLCLGDKTQISKQWQQQWIQTGTETSSRWLA
jgi:hypothetical protein